MNKIQGTFKEFPMAEQSKSGPLAEKQPELGDLVIEYLEGIGVEYIFGVPGGSIEPLYNAMARSARRGGLRPIVARHESGAAFMADGYARETGKLGVCCSTTGPGATNLITGVASAHADNIPLLAITAQTALPHFGKRALQESSCTAINTVAMFQACTRFSTLVSHRGQLEGKLLAAIMATQGPPKGAAHISIPMDVLASPRRMRPDYEIKVASLVRPRTLIDHEALDSLFSELCQARRIVLLLGDGCGEAIDEIIKFAELTHTPILCGPPGKRWVNSFHPLYQGVIGYGGHSNALKILQDQKFDLLLAVGTRLGELVTGNSKREAVFNDKLIHIDVAAEHFTNSPMARLHVCGTIKSVFKQMNERMVAIKKPGYLWSVANILAAPKGKPGYTPSNDKSYPPPNLDIENLDKCFSDESPIKPQRLMRELSQRFPNNTRFLPEAGTSWFWAIHYLHQIDSGLFRMGAGFGAMAWGIGAAVGTALGNPGTPVVCLTGDGNFLMSGQEITVAVMEKLPVIYIVLNDQAMGMIKHGQRLGGAEQIGFELPPVDFAQMAQAMGARGHTVRTMPELEALDFDEICRRLGPTLLDVYIDPEEVPPIGARLKTLGR
jgi:acetolactate synthase-1/2/3 large subunit